MRKLPSFAELLGLKAVSGQDVTGNQAIPMSTDPKTTQRPNRYKTLDEFEPGRALLVGDNTSEDFSPDEDDDALLDVAEPAAFANSQLDLVQDLPSTTNVNRFVHQQRKK